MSPFTTRSGWCSASSCWYWANTWGQKKEGEKVHLLSKKSHLLSKKNTSTEEKNDGEKTHLLGKHLGEKRTREKK